MATLNYATSYQQALDQAYPYVLNFGALYATENNGRYRWTGSKTIEIPHLTTTGRVASSRDTIGTFSRNFDNSWEPKTLTNQRKWSTLVHPMDIDQTNMTTTIANITQVFNDEQKFPEMDAYVASKIYADWTDLDMSPSTTALTTANILGEFDALMLKMDNARVPANGRILYVTHEVKSMLKSAQDLQRTMDVKTSEASINRQVDRLDQVEIVPVPSTLMKSAYDFTTGWAPATTADQINMMLIHPNAVITPVSYTFSQLEEPAATTEGKYVYFEESFEDVFVLDYKKDAIQMNVTPTT